MKLVDVCVQEALLPATVLWIDLRFLSCSFRCAVGFVDGNCMS